MEQENHTPAPWVIEDADNPMEWANVYGGENYAVCALYANGPDYEEANATDKANANLILAAPELLAVLEDILGGGYLPSDVLITDVAIAAVAKARGGA